MGLLKVLHTMVLDTVPSLHQKRADPQPRILVDWSDIVEQQRLLLIRAALVVEGRALPLYEAVDSRGVSLWIDLGKQPHAPSGASSSRAELWSSVPDAI